jgi:hypothetical protein
MEHTIPHTDRPFTGNNVQSVLASVNDAQDTKNRLLHDIFFETYTDRQQIVLPYLLPFKQAHCRCCRWSYPLSSARAILPPYTTDLVTRFTTAGSHSQPRAATADIRYFRVHGHHAGPLGSSVFTIRPGRTSIWCGLKGGEDSILLQYLQFLIPPSRHTDYIQCKPAHVIIDACRC